MSQEQEFNLKLNTTEATVLLWAIYELEQARAVRINAVKHRSGLAETIGDLSWENAVLSMIRNRLTDLAPKKS